MSLKGTLIFTANDGTHGNEDVEERRHATAEPSWSMYPSRPLWARTPTSLTVVGNTLFFAATDGVHGPELWTMTSFQPEPSWSRTSTPGPSVRIPAYLVNVNGTLFYQAYGSGQGYELFPQRRHGGRDPPW